MQELIRRSMDLWQRARRDGASRDEVSRCLAVVPELCGELEACRERRVRRRSAVEWVRRDDVERLGRHLGHEIRNRLNVVELSIERVAQLSGDARVHSALEPVRRSFRRLEAMAEDLRYAAAPGPAAACARGVPLRTVIDDLLSTYRVLAEERDVRLETDGEVPDVEVDPARLDLILANLLSNALRHPDPVKTLRWVRIQARTVGHDGGEPNDGHASLRCGVIDNGLGIPAERLPTLFEEPPPDDDGAPARRGLGLVIVRQAVERSGGRVWIESRESEGTGVYFTCTAYGVAGRSERAAPAARSAAGARGGH